ncbi:MAG: hypothetical protein FWG50_02170 [Kiritimatiellaeota bacterium]|nr:hypothetical protein [Kiritimatiellota bacterium]
MRRLDLSGEWTVRKTGTKKIYKAVVPGCIHADLLAIREIPDPFIGRNLREIAWVAETEWTYENTFSIEGFLNHRCVMLCIEGLDGAAEIALNDVPLGKTEAGMHIVEFNVKPYIIPGKNKLAISFAAPVRKARNRAPLAGRPALPTVGINGDVSIQAFNGVRVRDVIVRQGITDTAVAELDVTVITERFCIAECQLEVQARVCYKNITLSEAREPLTADCQTLRLTLKNAQYWWPSGMGEQPLYEVLVDVLAERTSLEHVSRRIGICHAEIVEAKAGSPRLIFNRHPMYIKGTVWTRPDLYPARLSRVEYARLVKAAVVGNMNLLRVKDIAAYECNAFYDLCDEYGLMVWHDALEDGLGPNIRRIRHHPCMVLWGCDDPALTATVKAEDPAGLCLPKDAFTHATGFAPTPSLPEPRIIATYLSEEEQNLSHPACTYHAQDALTLPLIASTFIRHFLFPASFANHAWLSQIQHAVLIKREWERVRCDEPNTHGFINGHLNDCWPQASTASVDFEGRWKAAHYLLRKSLSPVWASGAFRPKTATVDLFAFNDTPKALNAELNWRMTRTQGDLLMDGATELTLAPATREAAASLKIGDLIANFGANDLFLWLYLRDDHGALIASNFVYFCEPREWALPPPRMRAEIRAWDDTSYAVTLTSQQVALWVWLSLDGMDARYDDNFFCLEPNRPMRIRITPSRRLKPDLFRQMLRIASLRDTWQERRTLIQMVASARKTQVKTDD